jgi:error-prone DNA polymerase
MIADLGGTGVTLGRHPMAFHRAALAGLRVLRASELAAVSDGTYVRVAGQVIVRQRPGTAVGFLFMSLEDETGIANAIVRPDLFNRYRMVLSREPYLLLEGTLQNQDGVVSVKVARVEPLPAPAVALPSHDFH